MIQEVNQSRINPRLFEIVNPKFNHDIIQQIDNIKSATTEIMSKKLIKEIYTSFFLKINNALNNSTSKILEDLILGKSRYLFVQAKASEWPHIDKKGIEQIHPRANFYYELLRYRYMISTNNYKQENLEVIFDFYREFLQEIGEGLISQFCLTEWLVVSILDDYIRVYSLLVNSNQGNKLEEIIDKFWDMPDFVIESIAIRDIDSDDSERVLINVFGIYFHLNMFKATILDNKNDAITKTFMKDCTRYDSFLMWNFPKVFFESVLSRAVNQFLILDERHSVKTLISHFTTLVEAFKFYKTYINFIVNSSSREYLTIVETSLRNFLLLLMKTLHVDIDNSVLRFLLIDGKETEKLYSDGLQLNYLNSTQERKIFESMDKIDSINREVTKEATEIIFSSQDLNITPLELVYRPFRFNQSELSLK